MARLTFNSGQVYTKKDIFNRTAFSKKEEPILDQALNIFRRSNICGADIMLIGGTASRFYIDAELTSRTVGMETTDVDAVIKLIPKHLDGVLRVKRLTDFRRRMYGTNEVVTDVEQLSVHSFFSFPADDPRYLDFKGFDLFHGSVGPIIVVPTDIDKARTFTVKLDDDTIVNVKLADPGLLLATMINPNSATETRIRRTLFILRTLEGGASEIGLRCGDVLKRTVDLDRTVMERIFSEIVKCSGTAKNIIEEFVATARQTLEYR
ncbi:MAG: hypothetical protein Q7S22_05190 [Candidatus Micrarchaeota archaeon]|nr:hypothetical protein [Candidatus Micrarchaeota archaeon]